MCSSVPVVLFLCAVLKILWPIIQRIAVDVIYMQTIVGTEERQRH